MAQNKPLTMNVQIDGIDETLRAFRRLPKDASNELRDRAKELAEKLAGRAQSAARSDRSPQARLIAPTIKARRDRVPVIVAGGAKRVGRRKVSSWHVLFGSEFGSNQHGQFRKRHQGKRGSYLFPVVEDNQAEVSRAWNAAADAIVRKFTSGGITGLVG